MMTRWITAINALVVVMLATFATWYPIYNGYCLLGAFISCGIAIGAIALELRGD